MTIDNDMPARSAKSEAVPLKRVWVLPVRRKQNAHRFTFTRFEENDS